MKNEKQNVGIHSKGKNAKIFGNLVVNADVGILDEGENAILKGNKLFRLKKYTEDVRNLPLWLQLAVAVATILATIFAGWSILFLI